MKTPPCVDGLADRPQPHNPVIGIDGLARLLYRDRATLLADRCRAPDRVPPAYRVPGTRQPLWLVEDVLRWLREHPEYEVRPHQSGRPNKAQQVHRQRRSKAAQCSTQSVAGRVQP